MSFPMQADDFQELQRTWEELANEDPLWAILSVPSKKGGKWDLQEFFSAGKTEINGALRKLLAVHSLRCGEALDFGCGVGRLTQALADRFQHVIGIDISTTMIQLANQFNRHGDKVEYVQNTRDDLRVFADHTFDLVYSTLVLQHMKHSYAVGYIEEFFRVTRPGGAIVFQIPSHLTESYLPASSTERPLASAVCRANIRLLSGPVTLAAGQQAELQFAVMNTSDVDWLQSRKFQLNLGNHWLRARPHSWWSSRRREEFVAYDDGRARLPGKLGRGETANVSLTITAPQEPGRYYMEIDVVQERVRWFKDAGSTTLLLGFDVVESSGTGAEMPPPKQAPRFIMEGLPRPEVERLIVTSGAHLLCVEENVSEWHSYKYYIAR